MQKLWQRCNNKQWDNLQFTHLSATKDSYLSKMSVASTRMLTVPCKRRQQKHHSQISDARKTHKVDTVTQNISTIELTANVLQQIQPVRYMSHQLACEYVMCYTIRHTTHVAQLNAPYLESRTDTKSFKESNDHICLSRELTFPYILPII